MAVEDLLLAYIQNKQTTIGDQTEIDTISPDMVADIGIDLANILRLILPDQNRFTVTSGSVAPTGGSDTDLYFQSGLNQISIWRNSGGVWTETAIIPTSSTILVDGVLTGLRLSVADFIATISNGSWIIDNSLYSKSVQTQFVLDTAHATQLRYDIIYANKSNQILLTTGTPSDTPIVPDLPDDTILVETITIPSVASGQAPFSDFSIDLTNYVVKEAGKGLSTEDFTTEEKTKLASLEDQDLSGYATQVYVDAQDDAIISQILDTVDVDYNNLRKIQDKFAAILVLLNGDDVNLDQIKELADAIKADADNIEALTSGKVNISDIYNALDYVLEGKVLDARQGKVLNDLITTLTATVNGKEPSIAAGTEDEFFSGLKTWINFATKLFSSVLPALVAGVNTPIVAGISLTTALQNLQAQITALGSGAAPVQAYSFAASDETTDLTAGTAKISFRMPYAFTLSNVKASLNVAATGSTFIVNIKENGSTIFSTNLSIDAGELTSATAATPVVISDASLADDSLITVDIVQVGSTTAGKGLKISFIGTKS